MATKSINVTVTPIGIAGNDVDCDFAGGGEVISNAIFLDKTDNYDITFQLVSAHGVNAFAAQKPFCNQPKRCPKPPGGNATPPFQLTANTGNTITLHVAVDPIPKKKVSYFRLNFNNSLTSDPIIIHD